MTPSTSDSYEIIMFLRYSNIDGPDDISAKIIKLTAIYIGNYLSPIIILSNKDSIKFKCNQN